MIKNNKHPPFKQKKQNIEKHTKHNNNTEHNNNNKRNIMQNATKQHTQHFLDKSANTHETKNANNQQAPFPKQTKKEEHIKHNQEE